MSVALYQYSRTLCLRLHYHCHTLFLFTAADFKTIFFPITAFACATSPLQSLYCLVRGWSWIWMHQLMCNVSNQARGREEDRINKPWRPLPSGRITEAQAVYLRWVVAALCLTYSALYGGDLVVVTLALLLTTVVYDELGLAGHHIGKSFCNIGGYTTFEIGAIKLMGGNRDMDEVSLAAVCVSALLIFTTIQAQDFADVEGDRALGRLTFPIYAPKFSRVWTLISIILWSYFLGYFWSVGAICRIAVAILGTAVGSRFYFQRTADADRFSYLLYNVWLMVAHVLPFHTRTGHFGF